MCLCIDVLAHYVCKNTPIISPEEGATSDTITGQWRHPVMMMITSTVQFIKSGDRLDKLHIYAQYYVAALAVIYVCTRAFACSCEWAC